MLTAIFLLSTRCNCKPYAPYFARNRSCGLYHREGRQPMLCRVPRQYQCQCPFVLRSMFWKICLWGFEEMERERDVQILKREGEGVFNWHLKPSTLSSFRMLSGRLFSGEHGRERNGTGVMSPHVYRHCELLAAWIVSHLCDVHRHASWTTCDAVFTSCAV